MHHDRITRHLGMQPPALQWPSSSHPPLIAFIRQGVAIDHGTIESDGIDTPSKKMTANTAVEAQLGRKCLHGERAVASVHVPGSEAIGVQCFVSQMGEKGRVLLLAVPLKSSITEHREAIPANALLWTPRAKCGMNCHEQKERVSAVLPYCLQQGRAISEGDVRKAIQILQMLVRGYTHRRPDAHG